MGLLEEHLENGSGSDDRSGSAGDCLASESKHFPSRPGILQKDNKIYFRLHLLSASITSRARRPPIYDVLPGPRKVGTRGSEGDIEEQLENDNAELDRRSSAGSTPRTGASTFCQAERQINLIRGSLRASHNGLDVRDSGSLTTLQQCSIRTKVQTAKLETVYAELQKLVILLARMEKVAVDFGGARRVTRCPSEYDRQLRNAQPTFIGRP